MVIHTLAKDCILNVIHTEVADHKMMIHAVVALWQIVQKWYSDPISHLHKAAPPPLEVFDSFP